MLQTNSSHFLSQFLPRAGENVTATWTGNVTAIVTVRTALREVAAVEEVAEAAVAPIGT